LAIHVRLTLLFAALAVGLFLFLGWAVDAAAMTIDVDDKVHGETITSLGLVSVQVTNQGGGPNRALAFDTTLSGTADPDLEDPWAVGNLVGSDFGRAIIIAENEIDENSDGLVDSPDDEAGGGILSLVFSMPVVAFELDLLDIDLGEVGGTLSFWQGGAQVASFTFLDLMARDASVVFGDNSANRIRAFIAGDEIPAAFFDRVDVAFPNSGAIDNLVAEVPEPAGIALLAITVLALVVRNRARRQAAAAR